MSTTTLILVLALLTVLGYRFGTSRVNHVAEDTRKLHSRPAYHGYYVALWCGLPAFLLLAAWLVAQPVLVDQMVLAGLPDAMVAGKSDARLQMLVNRVHNLASGEFSAGDPDPAIRQAAARYNHLVALGDWALTALVFAVAVAGLAWGRRHIHPALKARPKVEYTVKWLLFIASTIAVLTTLGIVLSLLFEAIRFFGKVSPFEFFFALKWSPQTAIREGQVGASGMFGAIPLFAGTMLISVIAMAVAAPVGLLSAIYLSEYAPRRVRAVAKPAVEVLAGVPTVVYGFFAALTVGPYLADMGTTLGLDVSAQSALAAGGVMGIMIIPFVSSLADDVITAVPTALREGSYGLGATQSETVKRVIFPAALPGIVGGLLLAVSRAIGETMIVVMAAGLSARLTANPLEAVTTVTVQIVTLLTGDQAFDSAKTLAAFALGLTLFFVTLGLNVIALTVVRKYREQYE